MDRVGTALPSAVALRFAGVGKRFATGTLALDGVDLELPRASSSAWSGRPAAARAPCSGWRPG